MAKKTGKVVKEVKVVTPEVVTEGQQQGQTELSLTVEENKEIEDLVALMGGFGGSEDSKPAPEPEPEPVPEVTTVNEEPQPENTVEGTPEGQQESQPESNPEPPVDGQQEGQPEGGQEGGQPEGQQGDNQSGDNTPADTTKAQKRSLSWTEATELIPTEFAAKKEDGKADLKQKLKGLLGAARETFSIPGYNDGVKVSFAQKFNLHWDVAEKQLEAKRATVGRIITFSLGPSYNHFIVIVPVASVEAVQRDGSKVVITKENAIDNVQAGTNHGRTYKKARHLAQYIGLAYKGIEPGKYCISNEDNLNLFQDINGNWKIYTKKGNPKTLGMEPEELLADTIAGGEKWKVING